MNFSYKFSGLYGTVYRKGDIRFSSDGTTLLCPVGNRISVYDLKLNRSYTLPVEASYNYCALDISPNKLLLVASIEGGEICVINLNYRNILYKKLFKCPAKTIKFSPNGIYFLVAVENKISIFKTPGINKRVFNPFSVEKGFINACDDITCSDWSSDSRFAVVGANDMSVKVLAVANFENFTQCSLSSTDKPIGVYFYENALDIIVVCKGGKLVVWGFNLELDTFVPKGQKAAVPVESEENDQSLKESASTTALKSSLYSIKSKAFLFDHLKEHSRLKLSASAYHKKMRLLVTAYSSGDFLLHDMTEAEVTLLHSLNVSNEKITSVAINNTGDWIALGISHVGQLLVWEWLSETYILKQQGHFSGMYVCAYSPDGVNVATGGHDGKVKLWSSYTCFCFVTFSEHTSSVTGLAFTQSGKAVLSSSLDGTVRAYDLTRYRNFRTLTSPRTSQFSCVSVDTSGELVVAGGQDTFEIYLWSLKTGKLLEVLCGHTGPVGSLAFSKKFGSSLLVSTGWDSSVKVWDAIATTTARETVTLSSDGMCVTFRPDGAQIAVATMDGQITLFNPETLAQEGNITGRDDLWSGRADADKITAKKSKEGKCFTTLCYSADGAFILAGGQSKNVCIYNVLEELLIKKFEIIKNKSLDAMDEIVNRKKIADMGVNLALIEGRNEDTMSIPLPGVQKGDKSTRFYNPEVRVSCLTFSPSGRSWIAATTEGLLVYSLDSDWLFDPLDLDISNTPTAVKQKIKEKEYSTALMMAIRLNLNDVKKEAFENVPTNAISLVARNLPFMYVNGVLQYIADNIENSQHLEFYMMWVSELLLAHGYKLKEQSVHIMPLLNSLHRSITTMHNNLCRLVSHNKNILSFLIAQGNLRNEREEEEKQQMEVSVSNENLQEMFSDEMHNRNQRRSRNLVRRISALTTSSR